MKKFEVVKQARDFDYIIKHGRYAKNKLYVIYYMNSNSDIPKFGLAVGKRCGNAVERNKIKRQLRSIIDNNKNIFKKSVNYIIIVKKDIIYATFKEMEDSLVNLVRERVR